MAVSSSAALPWAAPCPPCRRSFLRRLWRGGFGSLAKARSPTALGRCAFLSGSAAPPFPRPHLRRRLCFLRALCWRCFPVRFRPVFGVRRTARSAFSSVPFAVLRSLPPLPVGVARGSLAYPPACLIRHRSQYSRGVHPAGRVNPRTVKRGSKLHP